MTIFRSLTLLVFLASCSLPRGAALQSEITRGANSDDAGFAVYQVTRDFLPNVALWPETGEGTKRGWLAHRHVGANKTIKPYDLVNLVIWDSDQNSLLTTPAQNAVKMTGLEVSSKGTIFVPYVDEIKVSGMTADAARKRIQSKLSAIAPSTQVQLAMAAGAHSSVDMVGGVRKPGSYPLRNPHFTVLNLVSQAGGMSGLKNPQVRLIRAGKVYTKSLESLYENPNLDTVLKGGDKVVLEEDDRFFRSLGAASKESILYFREEEISALDAMSLIGGVRDSRADPAGILVLREYPSKAVRTDLSGPKDTRVVFSIDLTSADGLFSAKNFMINPQDTVLVTESPINNVRTVLGIVGAAFGAARTASQIGD